MIPACGESRVRRGLHRRQRLWLFAGLTLCLLLAAHRLWLPLIGRFLVVADPLAPADAVIPLAGDRSRVAAAADLLHQGFAPVLVLSDMWTGAEPDRIPYLEQVFSQALALGVAPGRIMTLSAQPASTCAEALALRSFAQRQGFRRLLVVTSPSHTRRARMILRSVFADTDTTVAVRPATNAPYHPDRWWLSASGRRETLSEYLKLVVFLLTPGPRAQCVLPR